MGTSQDDGGLLPNLAPSSQITPLGRALAIIRSHLCCFVVVKWSTDDCEVAELCGPIRVLLNKFVVFSIVKAPDY